MEDSLQDAVCDSFSQQQRIPGPATTRRNLYAAVTAVVVGVSMSCVADVQAATKKNPKNKSKNINADAEYESEIARLQRQLDAARRENELLRQGISKAEPSVAAPTGQVAGLLPGVANTAADQSESVAVSEESEKVSDLGEVVVRSRSALAKLKDVPKSISVVTGTELQTQNVTNFRDIVGRVGNLSMSYQNPYAGSLMIRGLGWSTSPGPLDPSVGMTVDGVSYANNTIAAANSFIDIDTFEVDRGPQGTQGGKNSSVGTVNINSHAPTFTPEAYGFISYGERNTLSANATLNGSLVDGLLAFRGSFLREQGDGAWKNLNDPNYSYQNTDRTYGRAQFLLTPSENFSAKLILDATPRIREVSNNYVNFVTPTPTNYDNLDPSTGKPYVVNQLLETTGRLSRSWFAQEKSYSISDYLAPQINRLNQNANNYQTKGASAILDWKLGSHTLSSITAYKDFYFDSGGGPISVFDIDRSPQTGHWEFKQYSQELKLKSASGGWIDYQAGVYLNANETPQRWSTERLGSDAGAYFANTAQYNHLIADTGGQLLMVNSIDRLFTKTNDQFYNNSVAGYGNFNLHLFDPLTINAGLRVTSEGRNSESSRVIVDQGYGAAFNPTSVNNVALAGGFNSDKTSGVLGANTAAQTAIADAVALKYFNVVGYDNLSVQQKQEVADAKAIRAGRIGQLFALSQAQPYSEILPTSTLSPTYKFNDDVTGYFTWQHAEKAGISQIVGATKFGGTSVPVKKEVSNAYEVGLKTTLLDKTLAVSGDFYLNDIENYIQPLYFFDPVQTALSGSGQGVYNSGLGNAPAVQSRGFELDVTYSGLERTLIRFAGAYTDAFYKDFTHLAKPLELQGGSSGVNYVPYYNATGKNLPGAAQFTANTSVSYSYPIWDKLDLHTNINYRFSSGYNNDPSLSRYAWVGPYGITDLALGIGRRDKLLDVSLIMKNVFDTQYGFLGTWNSYYPSNPRWIGLMVSARM